MRGDNLAQIASKSRQRNNGPPFSEFSAYLEMCYQVALSIEHMHAKGVVHLDLKASNILGRDGQIVLADFWVSARQNRETNKLFGDVKAQNCS
jgi:serine/threonine protein kinase